MIPPRAAFFLFLSSVFMVPLSAQAAKPQFNVYIPEGPLKIKCSFSVTNTVAEGTNTTAYERTFTEKDFPADEQGIVSISTDGDPLEAEHMQFSFKDTAEGEKMQLTLVGILPNKVHGTIMVYGHGRAPRAAQSIETEATHHLLGAADEGVTKVTLKARCDEVTK